MACILVGAAGVAGDRLSRRAEWKRGELKAAAGQRGLGEGAVSGTVVSTLQAASESARGLVEAEMARAPPPSI